MATVRDIAKKCSVSLGTVSRVLNNSANVKDATRQKVLAAIKALKYDPRDNTPEVRRVSLTTYGLVLPVMRLHRPGQYYERAVNSFSNTLEKYEKRCVLLHLPAVYKMVVDEGKNPRTALGVDKLVLAGINQPEGDLLLKALQEWEMPCVLVRRKTELNGIPVISDDDRKAMETATNHLLSLGHTRLAFINIGAKGVRHRPAIFLDCLRKTGARADDTLVYSQADAGDDIDAWLDTCIQNGVSGIVAGDDQIAVHFLKYCRKRGLGVPEDVSLVSIGGGDLTELFVPGITAVRIPLEKMIEMAVIMLNGDAAFSNDEQYCMEIPNELIIRETTAAVKRGM